MSEQDNSKSAFVESMKQTDYFTEWIETKELVNPEDEKKPFSDAIIRRCNDYAEKITFESGSYIHKSDKTIYIFTVHVDKGREDWDKEYRNELQILLNGFGTSENELESITAKKKEEKGADNVYYWRLVFNCIQEPN